MAHGVAGLVLAGGKSTRFGSDKASAVVAGKALLEWVVAGLEPVCDSLTIVVAAGQVLPPFTTRLPVTIAPDLYAEKGPLAGLVSGFGETSAPLCFAVSCDAPLVRPELVTALAALADDYDVVCPLVGGILQPLAAVYRPAACLPVFRDFVERGQLKITAAFGPLRVRVVREYEVRAADPEFESFLNLNRPDGLAAVEARLLERK